MQESRLFEIEFSKKKYKIRAFSYRAAFQYETDFNKSVAEIKTLKDNVEWVYCLLDSLNEEFNYSIKDFVRELDDNPQLLVDIQKIVSEKK